MRARATRVLRARRDPTVRRGRVLVPLGIGAILVCPMGCTSTTGPATTAAPGTAVTERALTWSRVVLPQGVEPVTLTRSGGQLLVGGLAASGRVRPRLLRVAPDGRSSELKLVPRSGYAFEARWRSIASDGRTVIAVGGAPGGAHFNTRWTTWVGTTAGVSEIPQPFETFGGWGAGDLIGPVLTSSGPAIAGSWEGAKSGLDAAIWLPHGDRWVRQSSAGSALESTRSLLVGPRAATAAGAGIVLAGSALHLADGKVRPSPAAWWSKLVDTRWTRADLPGSGASGEAVAAQCLGQKCVLAGYVDGAIALWRMSAPVAARIPGVPNVAATARSRILAPLLAGSLAIEVVSGGRYPALLAGAGRQWTRFRGPAGEPTSSALVGGWVYVVAEQTGRAAVLWRCPARDLGVRPSDTQPD